MKASDIPDQDILGIVDWINQKNVEKFGATIGAMRWDISEAFEIFPEKVVYAKLGRLTRRGLLDGCNCGCRGDFELTDAGRKLLDD